jgi:hypothetical protein
LVYSIYSSTDLDSPTRRVLERRDLTQQYDDGILDIEVISSPPLRAISPPDQDITVLSMETMEETPVTPLVLGGSKFRRKQIVPTDISSPVTISATHNKDSLPISLLETQELGSSPPVVEPPIPSPVRFQPSTLPSRNSTNLSVMARTSSGKVISISKKPTWKKLMKTQEQRDARKAQKEAYYGIDIHRLLDKIEDPSPSTQQRYSSSFQTNIVMNFQR